VHTAFSTNPANHCKKTPNAFLDTTHAGVMMVWPCYLSEKDLAWAPFDAAVTVMTHLSFKEVA
jgi:hypothetical protein